MWERGWGGRGPSLLWLFEFDGVCAAAGGVASQAGASPPCAPTGILLNNQMGDFSTAGQLNVFGYPPSPSNFIRCG